MGACRVKRNAEDAAARRLNHARCQTVAVGKRRQRLNSSLLLTITVLLPLASAFLAFLFPAGKPKAIRTLAIFATGVSLLITLTLFANFDRTKSGYQFVRGVEWLPTFGCSLKFGVDGISMTLLLLVGFVSFAGTLISSEIHDR